jgi:hypothetical protein
VDFQVLNNKILFSGENYIKFLHLLFNMNQQCAYNINSAREDFNFQRIADIVSGGIFFGGIIVAMLTKEARYAIAAPFLSGIITSYFGSGKRFSSADNLKKYVGLMNEQTSENLNDFRVTKNVTKETSNIIEEDVEVDEELSEEEMSD